MKKILSTVIGAMVALAFLFTMTGCGSNPDTSKMVTANSDDSQMTITALEKAQVIKLKKAMFNWGGDSWTVTADDKEVATIKGQAFKLIGDTYSMYSSAGNFVGAEGEQFRIINHSAQMYDFRGNKNGTINEEFTFILNSYTFNDAAGQKIGKMDQDFALTTSGTAKDTNNVEAWSFSKAAFSLGAELTMTRKAQTKIPAMTAVWAAVIMNEVAESSSKGSSKSHK